MTEQENSAKSELWSLSLRDLFYKYVRFLPVFILSVALALFIAYAYLRYATPIYNVSGTMLIKSQGQNGSGRSDRFEDLFVNDKAQSIVSEIEVLKSRPLMERVVRRLGLQFNYYAKGKIKTSNIYTGGPFLIKGYEINDSFHVFSLKIKFVSETEFTLNDEARKFHFNEVFKNTNGVFSLVRSSFSPISKDYVITWQPTSGMATSLAGSVAVTPKSQGTGILNISMMTPNSQLGADVINVLMEEYAVYTVEQKNQQSDQIVSFIEDRSRKLGHELDSVQQVLLDFSQINNIIDIEAQSGSYFNAVSEADKAIAQQEMQVGVVQLINDYVGDKENRYSKVLVPSSLGLPDMTLNSLVTAYNTAQIERQALIEGNVPRDNPLVREKEQAIEKLRLSVIENLRNVRSSMNASIGALRKQSNSSQAQLKALPFKAKDYYEIKRQVESKQALYKLLQEKKEETSISRAANIPNSNIIDHATPSGTPVKPNKRSIQILAILLGIGLPAMIIFIGEVLNDKVTTRFDIEKITAAPIVGEVGHSYSEKVLLVNKTTRSMVAEQFRIIRSNLQYIIGKSEKSTFLVTSSFSGEGKSFISINMGAVLALAGRKTVILEFDIRKPKVLSGLEMPKGPGITNYLVGKAELKDIVRPVEGHENLFVLGCGPIPPNPSELLLEDRVEEMFRELKAEYDVVIIDTAPVGMVSDALTLGKMADCTLYLVRQGHTFKKQVALIDEFYRDNKLPKISLILNDVKMKPGYGYYGYGRYGYGYGYGYGSYYEEEHPPQSFLERTLSALDIRRFFSNKKKK